MKITKKAEIAFGVYIVSTPIGNLKDISERAINILDNADFIICENPKHSLKLLNKFGIKKKLISLHDYNENLIIQRLSSNLLDKIIVLISDSGSPLISDPGYKFIKHCIENNININSIPGPTSVIPALQLSAIPMNEFSFLGFFPKELNLMKGFLDKVENSDKTVVFFVSSHKLKKFLELIEIKINNRAISVAKELTKINEKVFRGLATKIRDEIFEKKENLKGEFVVVVEGKSVKKTNYLNLEDYDSEIYKLLSKFSLTDVVEIVHKLTGITKNKVYKWVLKLKNLQD